VLGIDPFDQPNVQESKDNTKALLKAYAEDGELPQEATDGERFAYPAHDSGLGAALAALLDRAGPGEYLAIQAFIRPDPVGWETLQRLRLALRDRLRIATTLGYGPRYLHSTGQFHKGGPARGLFLQVIGHDPDDVTVPGQPYSFGVLKRAQARGDLAALRARGKPVMRVCLGDDVGAGLERLAALVAGA